ncbi:UPF0178 protein [Tanticharoenia sakaeratensis NBRC 103193]|uniref:UPF0178 protein Tasa_014_001 n=2 Tax=Tanticharoenia TaxID=444052 RepID=A0A0D6MKK7_9PROT|nr:UPF0178 protein [Tanticharoenia sakaeratensis NBRC 103193]
MPAIRTARIMLPEFAVHPALMQAGGMIRIFIDSDACPVKDEVYRVAGRYGLHVFVVSNRMIAVPESPLIERVVVDSGPDVADDWIAERASDRDIVITADIPLAARCVEKGAYVLEPKGRLLDSDAIGMALAMRNLMTDLRSAGVMTPGGAAFGKTDRSRFLSVLDTLVVRAQKQQPGRNSG